MSEPADRDGRPGGDDGAAPGIPGDRPGSDDLSDRPERLVLVGRVDCHLCEVAKVAIARVAEQAGVAWREVDVDSDPALQAEYWDRVPVILLDGREHGYWRVEEERLLRDLEKGRGVPEPTAGEHRRVEPEPGSSRRRGAQRSVFVGWQQRSERGGDENDRQ